MTVETAQRRRVVIVDGTRRHDIAVPLAAALSDVLFAVGAAPRKGRDVLVEADGREIEPTTRVENLRDGAVVILADLARTAPRKRRGAAARVEGRPSGLWWFLGAAGAVLGALALFASPLLDQTLRQGTGVVTAAASLAAGVVLAARAPRKSVKHHSAVVSILLLAFGGAAAATPTVPAAGVELSVTAGLLFAAAVAGVMGVVSRSHALSAEVRAVMVVLLVLSVVWGGALLLHLDATSAAAVTLGLAPVAQRVLLSSLVDVAPGTFLDYARFQTTRWSVRQQLPEEVRSIDASDAGALVERSSARLMAGTFALVAAVVVAAPVAFPGFVSDDPLVFAGRIALGATVVLAFMLGARKSTIPATRWMLRIGAAAVVAAVLRALIPSFDAGMLAVLAAACLVAGTAAALLVIPAARGVNSLSWSRFGDVFEWLAIALSLPAGLLAADAVDAVRGMMAA